VSEEPALAHLQLIGEVSDGKSLEPPNRCHGDGGAQYGFAGTLALRRTLNCFGCRGGQTPPWAFRGYQNSQRIYIKNERSCYYKRPSKDGGMKRTIASRLRHSSLWFAASVLAASCLVKPAFGEDIRIEKCDRLPVIQLIAAGQQKRFLLDTAATSILNLGSFSSQNSREISITSWRGTVGTSAPEGKISGLVVGSHRLRKLRIPAVDLSPIHQASRRPQHGIL